MTLSDPQPEFHVHCILTSRISQKRCILGTKLLKNTNRKPKTIYRMVQLLMTLSDLWPQFQGHYIFDIEYLRNDTRWSHSYYRTSIGSHMCSITWWHFHWPWRTPNSVFKVTAFLKWNISKTAHFRDKVTNEH